MCLLIGGCHGDGCDVPVDGSDCDKVDQGCDVPVDLVVVMVMDVMCLLMAVIVIRLIRDVMCLLVGGCHGDGLLLLVGCLTSQQHASVSQGRICTDNFTCCHTEMEAADQTFHLTQSQYTDTGLTSPSADPITPGAWQGSHWSANFEVTGMTTHKNPAASGIQTRDLPLSRQTP